MAHTGLTPCQFDRWNYQMFINIKEYKTVFEIRKDYLRIIISYGHIRPLFWASSQVQSYCQILQIFSWKTVPDNTSFSQMWIYS